MSVMDEIDGLDYEDVLLNGFDSVELRRENAMLKRRLETLEAGLAERNPCDSKAIKALRARAADADRYERLYDATLRRCEILSRKVRELDG